MEWLNRGFFALPLAIGLVLPPSSAQDRGPATHPAPAASTPKVLTGKERLGLKWTDEQRVDNCNVPLDKRGTRPRPFACENVPSN